MPLRFILGRAGTGKTHRCLEEIRERLRAAPVGPPLLLLVPEQATFQMEQALVHTPDLGGAERAHVLSFRRLAHRVFLELGGAARPAIDDLGKRMVLRTLLLRRAPELHLFGRQNTSSGLIDRLAASLTELRAYGQTVASLKAQQEALEAAGGAESPLWAKLHDLALVLADFQEYLVGRFTDPDDYLGVLAERVDQSRLVRSAEVWVDSFTSFTPQELAVLGGILRAAARVQVSLCVDPADVAGLAQAGGATDAVDPAHPFHPTLDTYARLQRLAVAAGVAMAAPIFLDLPFRFRGAPALAHLERQFNLPSPQPYDAAEVPVVVRTLADRRAEVAAAGQEVLRLCRDEGYRFRDIAILLRDFDAYGELLAATFRALGIPCFLDQRRTVSHHPAVELVRAALEVVSGDWGYEPVFRYLKTDLVPVARSAVDRLENYVLEHGIRGRRWYDGQLWNYIRSYTLEVEPGEPGRRERLELAELNATRDQVVGPLARLHRRVRRRPPVREVGAALFDLVDELGVAQRLREWAAAAAAAGDLDAAQEHEQVWQGIVELLDQTVECLGDERLGVREYLEVVEAGLEALRLGVIPPGLDQVQVGTVERSRHPHLRAVLIVGANDRAFPPAPAEDLVFTDREREALAGGGFELGPTSRTRLFHEQYLTYAALTRAAERLWISYPVADEAGKALPPAPVVTRLRGLFPSALGDGGGRASASRLGSATVPSLDFPGGAELAAVTTPGDLAAALVRQLRAARDGAPLPPEWLGLYAWAQAEPALRAAAAPVLAALDYQNSAPPLPPSVVQELYGDTLRTSVSRLESFAACPFQHFAAYGLRLREREQYRLEAPHLGQFLHAGLSLFVAELQRRQRDWAALSDAEIADLAGEVAGTLAPRLHSEILLSSGRYRFSLRVLRRTLNAALTTLAEHARRGRFRPVAVELDFGDGERLPPWRLELRRGAVELSGRIDRLDAAVDDAGRFFVRVLDYKSRPRSLAVQDVYYGLALQLSLYLLVALRGARKVAAGASGVLQPHPEEGQALAEAAATAEVRPAGAEVTALPAGMLYFPVHDPLLPTAGPLPLEAVAPLRRRKQFRTQGLLADSVPLLRAMEADLAGELIPAQANKDGSLRKGSRVASAAQWQDLFAHVQRQVAGLAGGILQGQVAVAPFRIGTRRPCTYCGFRPVCRFDPLVAGNSYRVLPKLGDAEAWQRLAERGEG